MPRGSLAPAPATTSPNEALTTVRMALAADQVYESVDALAYALQTQATSFAPWQRRDPSFRPVVSGYI